MSGDGSGNSMMDEPREDWPPAADFDPQPGRPEPGLQHAAPAPALARRIHGLLMGPEGLRSGSRFLLYAAMAWVLYWLLGMVLLHLQRYVASQLRISLIAEFGLFGVAGLPAFVMARIEKRRFDAYGLPRRGAFGKLFWAGALWGIIAITVLMLVMRGAGLFDFGKLALHGGRIFKFGAFWGVFFLLVGFFEEFLARGYTQFTLAQGIGFWPTAVLLSIGFGAIHLGNEGEAWIGALAAGVIGFFFCLTLRRTGNLWFAVGFHATWDWGESYLYSVRDSGEMIPGHLLNSSSHGSRWLTGGSVGPEGSVFVFVIIALLWVAFSRMYPEAKYSS
jgi:membrane protease YdiL (CAAX protease family)